MSCDDTESPKPLDERAHSLRQNTAVIKENTTRTQFPKPARVFCKNQAKSTTKQTECRRRPLHARTNEASRYSIGTPYNYPMFPKQILLPSIDILGDNIK